MFGFFLPLVAWNEILKGDICHVSVFIANAIKHKYSSSVFKSSMRIT